MQTNSFLFNHNSFSQLLIHLNALLSSYQEFPHNIIKALKKLGEFSQHDRIIIIEIHQDMTFSIRYEWWNQQTGPTPDKWRHAPIIHDPQLEEQLCRQNHIIIRREKRDIQHLLEEQNCKQMLLLPLFETGTHFSFISFLQCTQIHDWSDEEIQILCHLSSVIATRLNNYYMIHRMLHHLKKFHQQKTDLLLQYHRLKQIQTDLFPTWENIKSKNPHLPELPLIEKQIAQIREICQSLIER